MDRCSLCLVNLCQPKTIHVQKLSESPLPIEFEHYCADCLPYTGAPPGSHREPPAEEEYFYVFDHGVWYLAYVKNKSYSIEFKARLYNVLYCAESGKGRAGQLLLKNDKWYALVEEEVYRIEIWRNKEKNSWWRKRWRNMNN